MGDAATCMTPPLLTGAGEMPGCVFHSTRMTQDETLCVDPRGSFWSLTPAVHAEKHNTDGEALPTHRAEIRSRWTQQNLYFLFACRYEELSLKPNPRIDTETFGLWQWDVAEVFIGSDFENIHQYKEFEVSPQGEWVDLDIDLSQPDHEQGWTWESGMQVAARIDSELQAWYGAIRIPFASLVKHPPVLGDSFRINLFWSQRRGAQAAWRPTMAETFHVPEAFGLLQLVPEPG